MRKGRMKADEKDLVSNSIRKLLKHQDITAIDFIVMLLSAFDTQSFILNNFDKNEISKILQEKCLNDIDEKEIEERLTNIKTCSILANYIMGDPLWKMLKNKDLPRLK